MIITLEEKTYNKYDERWEGQKVSLHETGNQNFVELLVDSEDNFDIPAATYELTLNVSDLYDAMKLFMSRKESDASADNKWGYHEDKGPGATHYSGDDCEKSNLASQQQAIRLADHENWKITKESVENK